MKLMRNMLVATTALTAAGAANARALPVLRQRGAAQVHESVYLVAALRKDICFRVTNDPWCVQDA